jgi:hypothetical protein
MREERERKTRGFPFLLTNHARTPLWPPFKPGRDTWNTVWKTKSRPFLGQSGRHLKTSLLPPRPVPGTAGRGSFSERRPYSQGRGTAVSCSLISALARKIETQLDRQNKGEK